MSLNDATEEDLQLVFEALDFLWRTDLDFIFRDRSRIKNATVLVVDLHYIHVWCRNQERYHHESFKHTLSVDDINFGHWACGPFIKGLQKSLPKNITLNSFISGGTFSNVIEIQKKRNDPLNPFLTKESYLSTIIHEFGHLYYDSHFRNWFSDSQENHKAIMTAKKLYQGEIAHELEEPKNIPQNRIMSEIFAFCTDRATSQIFWPSQVSAINKANIEILNRVLREEGSRDPLYDFSPLDRPHIAALVWGPIIMERYGEEWPQFLLEDRSLVLS